MHAPFTLTSLLASQGVIDRMEVSLEGLISMKTEHAKALDRAWAHP